MRGEERFVALGQRYTSTAESKQTSPGTAPSSRRRHSVYIDENLMQHVDVVFKEIRHEAYPQEITKSQFLEQLLRHSLQDLEAI